MALHYEELNHDWVYWKDSTVTSLYWGSKLIDYECNNTDGHKSTYLLRCFYRASGYTSGTTVILPAASDITSWAATFGFSDEPSNSYVEFEFPDLKLSREEDGNVLQLASGSTMPTSSAPAEVGGFTAGWILKDVKIVTKHTSNALTFLKMNLVSGTTFTWKSYSGAVITTNINYNNAPDGYEIQLAADLYAAPTTVSFDLTTGVVKYRFLQKPVVMGDGNSFDAYAHALVQEGSTAVFHEAIGAHPIPQEVWETTDDVGYHVFEFTISEAERIELWRLADLYGTTNVAGNTYLKVLFTATTTFYDNAGEVIYARGGSRYAISVLMVGQPPEVDGEVYDINEKTLALTGNRDTLVRFHSTAHFTITGEAKDGATIEQLSVTNVGGIIAGSEGNFTKVESNIFYLDAVDSRGNIARKTITKSWIEYIKLTANIKANELSADGYASITVSGNYYGGSFGAVDNSLTLAVRYKTGDGEYGEWVTVNPSGGSSSYEYTIQLEGLDYMQTYTFQARATDLLEDVLSAEKVVSTIPVFDWGHDDFNFNVPVTIQGKRMGENTILWNGSSAMIATDRAELSEPISAQMNGIVLVFSAASGDVSWNMQYVPKVMVNLLNGGGMAFMMAPNAAMGKFGAKYLYISDDVIEGDVSNETAGTGASAIKFTNADLVLRYVIGV